MIEPSLYEVFKSHTGRQIDKWLHYFPIYERHFARYRSTPVRLLEIGVDHGGSLQLWKRYFGPAATIVGVDIDPRCKEYEEDQITVYTKNQRELTYPGIGPFDIVIDDGSHLIEDQTITFNNLWPATKGVYLIEDIHGAFPSLYTDVSYRYPWVQVFERPTRRIVGTPSRPLREDEVAAREAYGA